MEVLEENAADDTDDYEEEYDQFGQFVGEKYYTAEQKKKMIMDYVIEEVCSGGEKYCKVHYTDIETLEFRHHHGTLDDEEINHWVRFLRDFVRASAKKLKDGEKDSLWRGINDKTRDYYKEKIKYRMELKKLKT